MAAGARVCDWFTGWLWGCDGQPASSSLALRMALCNREQMGRRPALGSSAVRYWWPEASRGFSCSCAHAT